MLPLLYPLGDTLGEPLLGTAVEPLEDLLEDADDDVAVEEPACGPLLAPCAAAALRGRA